MDNIDTVIHINMPSDTEVTRLRCGPEQLIVNWIMWRFNYWGDLFYI